MENNGLTSYSCLLWIVNIWGRQRFVNGLSTVRQQLVIKYSCKNIPISINSLAFDLARFIWINKNTYIIHDTQAYLINTNNNKDLNPLELWRENGEKYQNVARVSESGWQFRKLSLQSSVLFDMLVSGYFPTVKYPQSIDRKVSIPLEKY